MSVDRTREFLSFVDGIGTPRASASLRDSRGAATPGHAASSSRPSTHSSSALAVLGAAPPVDTRNAFMQAIAGVSTDLHSTSMKIGALTKRVYGSSCKTDTP